jgi:hypothetical protein
MSVVKSPNFEVLKETSLCDDEIRLNQVFQNILDDIKIYLNLDLVNKRFKLHLIDTIETSDLDSTLFNRGFSTYIEKEVFHIELFKYYQKFFPFFLLNSAYKMFIIDELKQSKIIDFAINQIIDLDLHDYNVITDWRLFVQEKFEFFLDQSKKTHFTKYLEIRVRKPSERPTRFFFRFVRTNPDVVLSDDLSFFIGFLIQQFKNHSSKQLLSDELTETLRVLVKIFYNIINCDTLKGYYRHFKKFIEQKLIQTDLSFRSFRKNLLWMDRFSYITPTYYIDWKTLDQAVLVCHLKFNPLIEKHQIDKILKEIPFLVMPKLSITNFAVDLSTYFVLPRRYIKDLIYFLDRMERNGYLIHKELGLTNSYNFEVNLNYLKESYQDEIIINCNRKNYAKNYEINFKINFCKEFVNSKLSLLDFLILDSLRFAYYQRINFSRLRLLKKIKSDLSLFFSNEYKKVEELENLLKILIYSPNLIDKFMSYIEKFENKGFFYIKEELELLLNYFNTIEKSNEISSIENYNHFIEFVEKKNKFRIINQNGNLEKKELATDYDYIFQNFFKDKEKYKKQVENYRFFYKILNLFSSLKILNINSIKRILCKPELVEDITELKKNRLKDLKNNINQINISNKYINQRIDYFLQTSPKIIKPYLLDTILGNWSYFPELVLKNKSDVKSKLHRIIKYFHKVYFYEVSSLIDSQDYIFVQIHMSYLKNQEKLILCSLLSNIFKDNLISFKRYTWDGNLYNFSTRDFYDFNKKKFFYTNDLFNQYFLYVKNILGEKFPKSNKIIEDNIKLCSENKKIEDLIENHNRHLRSENQKFQKEDLQKLSEFHLNLEKYLLNKQEYKEVRIENYFKQYIRSIKFLPNFHDFGLSEYLLYITPFDFDKIDFKLLLTNTFKKVKHNSYIDNSNSLLISYIFPFEDPNISYLNWLRGQNKIREYCLFSLESLCQIINFDQNISLYGWDLEVNNFRKYVQEVLNNPDFKSQDLKVKCFDLAVSNKVDYHGPESSHFKSLLNFYIWHSFDLRKKLQFLNKSVFDELRFLIKNKILYPYLNLKNLGLKETIHFFLFNIRQDSIDILKTIFHYFNLVFFYEIKGEYYIHGFKDKKEINKGIMVKLYLPDCKIATYLRIFEYIFQFLKIEKYLILTDLVNGDYFVKSIFEDEKLFENYNPLNNLIWDPKRRKWKNHKLFGPKFEYLYPDLHYNQEDDARSITE